MNDNLQYYNFKYNEQNYMGTFITKNNIDQIVKKFKNWGFVIDKIKILDLYNNLFTKQNNLYFVLFNDNTGNNEMNLITSLKSLYNYDEQYQMIQPAILFDTKVEIFSSITELKKFFTNNKITFLGADYNGGKKLRKTKKLKVTKKQKRAKKTKKHNKTSKKQPLTTTISK